LNNSDWEEFLCGKINLSPAEFAFHVAGNGYKVLPVNPDLAILVPYNLLGFMCDGGAQPTGDCIIAVHTKNMVNTGYFEEISSKPVPFKGSSYFCDPSAEPLARYIEQVVPHRMRPMAFTNEVAEALIYTMAKELGLEAYWERNIKRQFGVDVTIGSGPASPGRVIATQPKLTNQGPYTRNVGWLHDYNKMISKMGKLKRFNRLVRDAEDVEFLAIGNSEIDPAECQRLAKMGLGYCYLHAYQML